MARKVAWRAMELIDRLPTTAWNHSSTAITTRLLATDTNMGMANLRRALRSAVNRLISP